MSFSHFAGPWPPTFAPILIAHSDYVLMVVEAETGGPGRQTPGCMLDSNPTRIAVTSAWARLVTPSFW
jgi:hypothetical protein